MSLSRPFRTLQNKIFARLYLAQTVSLLGDAFSWVGLALLAYQIDQEHAAQILATALTLRVVAFILFSPFAGVLADKVARKKILYLTHFFRMALVCCLPFVTAEWQIYVLVFLLNIFNAFFTPTYRSIIPQIVDEKHYREAIGLSTATFQLLGVLGPALAGIIAVWLGARQIFFLDGLSFIIGGLLILSIPKDALQNDSSKEFPPEGTTWNNVIKGIRLLFGHPNLRFALAIEFVSAVAGAMILVNSINLVKQNLMLGDNHYGLVMSLFGIGAAISAFILGTLDKSKARILSLISGVIVLGLSVSLANLVPFSLLMVLWLFAGIGQSLAEMPSETLIAENIASENQGKVYGSHFAFSHLWWALSYPLAGFIGLNFPEKGFLYGGLLTLVLAGFAMVFKPKKG